ncbi:MAG: flagellar basal-body MS-ring/collar protein FliF [Desulfobaccales bacterium]
MESIKNLLRRLRERFQALPSSQRLLIPALAAALLLALGFLFFVQGQSDYGVLFTNLSQEDAGEIVNKLKAKKVSYRLENNGTAILVPKSEMYELRLLLASEGLPKGGGVGFEIFDRQDLGTTNFVQHLNYQRALQGELARTIAGMPEILEARVHIVTPKESLFLEDQKEPSASVALKLRPGRTLSPAQVEAVVNLVASAVAGLHPTKVTVVDLKGRILSKPQDRIGFQGLTAGQLTLQRQVEESYETKVQELFDKILGPHKSFVRVSTELDFQKIDLREESFTPNHDLIRSEQKTYERSNRGLEGGNPEARFNLNQGTITPPPPGKGPPPLTAPASPKPSGTTSERSSELRNYEINRVVRQVVDSPGKIKRLSLAVVVDGNYQGKSNIFSPKSPEEMRQFANLAKKAVGFNAERGDQLEISCAPLAVQAAEGTSAVSPAESWNQGLAFSWKIGLLVILILGVLMVLLKRRRAPVQPPLLHVHGSPAPELSASRAQEGLLPGAAPSLTEGGQPPRPALPEPVDGQEKVSTLITSYPDRAVEVLRLWIHEKERR